MRRREKDDDGVALFVAMLFFACGESEEVSVQPEAAIMETASESVEKEIQQGGLLVRTMLTPKSLRLGDPFQLQITVEADTGIEIEMPPFGEALGRLTIVDFTPKQRQIKMVDQCKCKLRSMVCKPIEVERWLFPLCVLAID